MQLVCGKLLKQKSYFISISFIFWYAKIEYFYENSERIFMNVYQ